MQLWIDTDFGFDDLAAIALCQFGGAEIAGVSLVAGNAPLPQVRENAEAAYDAFGWGWPLYLGAAAPLIAPLETAAYVLGVTGMPSVGRQLPKARQPHPIAGDAVAGLAQYLRQGGQRILALGPLTNLAQLATSHPDLCPKMQVIWMGGAFGRGNHTAVAEFNAAVDPEAIQVLLDAGVDLTMVGLECCREVSVTLADLPPLRQTPGEGAQLLADLYEGYIRIAANGTRPMALYDPVAAALALNPETFESSDVYMVAETEGRHTRGMTVIEWRAHKARPNIRVALRPRETDISALQVQALLRLAIAYDASH